MYASYTQELPAPVTEFLLTLTFEYVVRFLHNH